jgi:hypothetical protein
MIKHSDAMTKQVDATVRHGDAISARIAKHEAAFKDGHLGDHSVVSTFATEDSGGQRGWGPMMQT